MPYSKTILSTIILPAVLVLAVPYFLVGGRLDFLGSMTGSWIRMLGLLPFAAGVCLVLLGARDAMASVMPSAPGQPSFRPIGLYRHVRNPIWLGVLVAVAAQFLLYDWPAIIAYLVVLFVASDCLIRLFAEPRLAERLGDGYARYLDAVPRWIPRRAPYAEASTA